MNGIVELDRSILREYDIRGIVGRTLGPTESKLIGKAFATMMTSRGQKQVVVGYDGRLSSPQLEHALVAGLAECGLGVMRIGRGPTPMLYFGMHHLGIGAGVMITGSHNPPDYNGLKLLVEHTPLTAAQIQDIGETVRRGTFTRGAGKVETIDLRGAYIDRLAAEYRPGRHLRVVWDTGSGATGEIVGRLTDRLNGLSHLLLNEEVDGTFPAHHPDPAVARNMEQLRHAVIQTGCDVGVAFDGDGDRIGVVDETGTILWPDQVLLLLARAVLRERPGASIVADVKSSQVLFDGIAEAGGRPVMSPSGYPMIRQRIRALQAPLAGEMSGHMFFADRFYGVDDAIYCAMRLLSVLANSGRSLAEFRQALPPVVNTPELRIPCPEHRKRAVVAEVAARVRAAGAEIVEIDGVRVCTSQGWWLLRASNTEPVLAARCEAATDADLERVKHALAAQLTASGIPLPPELASAVSADSRGDVDQDLYHALTG